MTKQARLLTKYQKEIVPALKKEFKTKNTLAVPSIEKITINTGITDPDHRDKALENMSKQIYLITGQKPIVTRAKTSIAGFKLRAGDPVGIMVTLRRRNMYEFFDKLLNIVLPRVKDFKGVKTTAFDGRGNYSLGISEQIVFPEVDYDKIDKIRSLQVVITTTTQSNKKAFTLLKLFGMPFEKKEDK